jgi:hypothetical protein
MAEPIITNRELTGHPEVPNTMRGFRDEKPRYALFPGGAAGDSDDRRKFYDT